MPTDHYDPDELRAIDVEGHYFGPMHSKEIHAHADAVAHSTQNHQVLVHVVLRDIRPVTFYATTHRPLDTQAQHLIEASYLRGKPTDL